MNEHRSTHTIQELTSEKTELRREVGLFGGISVLAGIMIGSGIFYIGGIVLQRSGMSLGLALLVWLAGGLITLMSGICYAELGAMMPKAGGSYVYLREAYGERVAFMSGFSNFVLGSSGSNAALAVAFSAAIASMMPSSGFAQNQVAQKGLAVGMILLLTLVNIFGIKLGSAVQNLFMVLKMLPIVLILVCGFWMGTETPSLSIVPTTAPSLTEICGMIAFGVVATMWAYEGWTNLNGIAEEIRRPKKNLPLAILASIIGVTVLYVLFNYAVYRVLPYDTIVSMIDSGNYYLGTEAANRLFGSAGGLVVGAAMILAIFNSLNGCVMVFPRTYYAMARDGAFFKGMAKLHPVYKTPVNALIVSGLVSVALVCTRNLSQLTSLVAFCGMVFNGLTFYAVIRLRKKYPDMERPYKVWGYPAMIVVICLIMVGLMVNTFVEDPLTSVIGLVVPAVGLVLYELVFHRGRRPLVSAEREV
ncbi:APC family permease [uncultured Ruthenibacterium sp.]|uniref:APC family permease n=1 Tax=uncultured Ruthenibacterium sp. TaxID=1905347 RepID=UPI00349EA3FF